MTAESSHEPVVIVSLVLLAKNRSDDPILLPVHGSNWQ